MRLDSLTMIVTGAGSGIGRATARLAGRAGARVVCVDIRDADKAAKEIEADGGIALGRELDVRSAEGWSELVAATAAELGGPDILANVAGVASGGIDSAVDQTEEEWSRVLDINLKGVWLGMRAVLPTMIERGGGRILNVASLAAVVGVPNVFAYSAAKGGVVSMSRQAAMDYADKNVLINVVAPGIIETPILGEITDDLRAYCASATPVGRMGRPEEIADTILHLAGPGGSFITGHTFPVDGGWSAR